jgi:hypothetical protein
MLAWVGADGGPDGFDHFGVRAQCEPSAISYPVGAQEGPRSFIRLLFSPSSRFHADADRERFCNVGLFPFVQLSLHRFSMPVVRTSAVR